jgi:hypothetical protein
MHFFLVQITILVLFLTIEMWPFLIPLFKRWAAFIFKTKSGTEKRLILIWVKAKNDLT